MAKQTKLHELLAAEGSLKTSADKGRADLENSFEKKSHIFNETVVTVHPFAEGERETKEIQGAVATTVPKELAWISKLFAPVIDVGYQIDEANMEARADIVLEDGSIIAEQVPATALMRLQHRVQEILDFAKKIPTLDNAKAFAVDPSRSSDGDIYASRPEVKRRTAKVQEGIVLHPPTVQHPAQTQLITKDVPVAELTTVTYSGYITSAAKGDILERAEALLVAVKKARSAASDVAAPLDKKIGQKLLAFVFEGR